MAKLRKNSKNPDAWIVSSKDKGRKSIKNGKVFLKNKEVFEIELYNPLKTSVLADIKLNSSSISKSGLVLRPGERFYLDCFIDDNKKFIFETYEVDNINESNEAIKNNGLLEVFFYKEDVVNINNWKNNFNQLIIEKWYPYNPYPYNPYPYQSPYYGTTTLTTTLTTGFTNTTSPDVNLSLSNNTITNDGDVNCSPSTFSSFSKIETGRVEKGENSSQGFKEVEMDFENFFVSSTIIKILPESRKPFDTKELKKKKKIKKQENTLELIKTLKDLYDNGILTDSEFSEKKKKLLSNI